MGIRLSEEEAWAFVAGAHTGILTTLRADGSPVTLPMWFVVDHRTVCFRTFAPTKKVARIAHDPRASFLVESGERWAELAAVHLNGRIEQVVDDDATQRIDAAIVAKYTGYFSPRAEMPESAQRAYAAAKRFYRFVAEPRILSWDNARL